MAVQRSAPLQKVPIRIQNMPIQPMKYAHPTYKKCPSDLQKMPIRPTKNAHPTYEKCPSNLQKVLICPTKLIGRLTSYNVLFLPATAL